jgi:hypothetical protein
MGGFGLSRIAALLGRSGAEPLAATGEAVTVGGFGDQTGGGHGGEALVESGGADAAGRAQFGERAGLVAACEGCGDALIDGSWFDTAIGLAIGLHRLEGKCVVALGVSKCNARYATGCGFFRRSDSAESRGNVGFCAGWRPSAIRWGKIDYSTARRSISFNIHDGGLPSYGLIRN